MKSSTIRYRVADFLRQYSPFNEISEADLLDLVMNGRVKFHESDEYIFRQGSKRSPYLYVIQQGAVRLFEQSGDRELLRDLRGEGDLVGIGQLLGESHYLYSAMSVGDVMLYAIPGDAFLALVKRHAKSARYLAAYFSVKTDFCFTISDQSTLPARREAIDASRSSAWLWKVLPFAEPPWDTLPTCTPDESISGVARLMRDQCAQALAVMDRDGCALGLITLEDLRDSIAVNNVQTTNPAASIMRRSLTFAPPGQTVGKYLAQLVSSLTNYIAITRDGQKNSQLLALLNEQDLTLHCGHNPVALTERIKCADSASQLSPVRTILSSMVTAGLDDPSAMTWYSTVLTRFDALIMQRIIHLAEKAQAKAGHPVTEIDHCWLLFGVAGRQELLIHRRPRWGLIYADPDEKEAERVNEWFTGLNTQVERMVEAAGYPSREERTLNHRSLSSWRKQFSRWTSDPIMSQTYRSLDTFDLTLLCGDETLVEALQRHIQSELECNKDHFIPLMANDAMAHLPPLTFFHGQVVDDHGARSSHFDLRHTTLQPLVDIARVFSFEHGWVTGVPTDLRLERCAADQHADGALFRQAAESFRVALRLQAMIAAEGNDEGQRINPMNLDKYEQQLLKSIFRDILALLKKCASHFQLVPRR